MPKNNVPKLLSENNFERKIAAFEIPISRLFDFWPNFDDNAKKDNLSENNIFYISENLLNVKKMLYLIISTSSSFTTCNDVVRGQMVKHLFPKLVKMPDGDIFNFFFAMFEDFRTLLWIFW